MPNSFCTSRHHRCISAREKEVVVQSLSRPPLCNPMDCSSAGSSSISQGLLMFLSTESVMLLCNHPILCYPLSFCLHSFPASGSFPVSWFASGGQSIGASASATVLPMNRCKMGLVFSFIKWSLSKEWPPHISLGSTVFCDRP